MNLASGMVRSHRLERQRLEHQRHAVAVSIAVATLTATVAGWTPSTAAAWTIVIVAIAIGLPHGALDVVIGPRLARPATFFALYVVVAFTIVLLWLAAPAASLVAFFASSWYHFARGDAVHHRDLAGAGTLLAVATAGCAIGLPLMLHAGIVTPVMSDLMLGSSVVTRSQVALLGAIIVVPSVIAGLVAGVAALRIRVYAAVAELTVIALVAATVHPLVSFALYFALWHAPRHLITLDIDAKEWWRAVWATVATLLAGAFVWRALEPDASEAARVVFIGLAALTGPHLALTELARSGRRPPIGVRRGRIADSVLVGVEVMK